eukprot:4534609-Pleurochrysis_carterae.AAC.3
MDVDVRPLAAKYQVNLSDSTVCRTVLAGYPKQRWQSRQIHCPCTGSFLYSLSTLEPGDASATRTSLLQLNSRHLCE